MLTDRKTLARFLIEERRRYPGSSGELNSLILDVALACKVIARQVAAGALVETPTAAAGTNVQGEKQHHLDVVANEIFLRANQWQGLLAGMASEELERPYSIPTRYPRGKYLLSFDPLDGSSNIDVNVSVGSIFSILRAPDTDREPRIDEFLRPGTEQVCSGYAIYGPATMLVLTVGRGVHGFTLDPVVGEFFLTHPDIRIPDSTAEFAVNSSNRRFWEPAVTRYIDECLAGLTGPREKDFNMRWVASLVAETHRILMRGGVFLYPRDSKDPSREGRLRLLYEASPVALLVEQAGGLATTGRERILDIQPRELHQRVGLIFGSSEEVQRLERYHAELPDEDSSFNPLYAVRGLFRVNA